MRIGVADTTPRLLLLTPHPELATPRRLIAAARSLGVDAHVVRAAAPRLGTAELLASGRRLLTRPGSFSLVAILRAHRGWVRAGATPLQGRQALLDACDQWRTLVRSAAFGVPCVPARLIRHPSEIDAALDAFAPGPWFVKGRWGSQGTQVLFAAERAAARRHALLFWGVGASCLIEPDLRTTGRVERHLVVGGRVVASAIAHPAAGETRSNAHRGGRFEPIVPGSSPAAEVARRAVLALGLPLGAVDTIGVRAPRLLEVNASPGIEALERATGADLATTILATLLGIDRAA